MEVLLEQKKPPENGWSDNQIIDVFEEYEPEHYAKKGSFRIDWFKEYMLKPARGVIPHPQFQEEIINSINWVMEQPWAGKIGSSDKSVLVACCERARLETPYDFRATERELVELSGVTRKTVSNSIDRLIGKKLLIRINKDYTKSISGRTCIGWHNSCCFVYN
jgi:hypothetical protein